MHNSHYDNTKTI